MLRRGQTGAPAFKFVANSAEARLVTQDSLVRVMVEERGTSDAQLAQLEARLETRIRTQVSHHTTLTESHSFMGG